MARPPTLRLFVAIELPPPVTDALARTIEGLRSALQGPYRWVAATGIHLTLKFLGDVDGDRVDAYGTSLAAAAHHGPFPLRLSGAGMFAQRGVARVVWAGLGGQTESLDALRDTVDASLVATGATSEARAFRPHLTLARVPGRLTADRQGALVAALAEVSFAEDAAFDVRSVSLMRSQLGRGEARYSRISSVALAG